MEERTVVPGELYRHFKNKLYQIVAVAYHSETKEKMVVYQALYGTYDVYVRPYDMFLSEVDHAKYPDVKDKFRFTKVEKEVAKKEATEPKSDVINQEELAVVDESTGVNPILMEFFDKETSADKIEYIRSIRSKIDERIVSDMAASMDITIDEGDLDSKIDSLLICLKTKAKYECNRFR